MSDLDKSYNKYRKQYRTERANQDSDEWKILFIEKRTMNLLIQTNYVLSGTKFRIKPYRYYFLRSFLWSIKRIINDVAKELKKIQLTNLKVIVTGIIITIIGTAILKFILHWI